ncbi:hypothetical protein [Halosolutus gelatinilyticus]|uniref:hypothetical protein n=1 Tax=Halosolutus gelatinilyticus TaxID=2931975 RepID=UPI001FF3E1E5|nr:hypothetical protein [Halosolutus gelatinilyticus]
MNEVDHSWLSDEGLSPRERQDVYRLDSELNSIRPQYDGLIFVLGNYDRGRREKRITDFREQAHEWGRADLAAVRMDQFLENVEDHLGGHCKFKVIADHADAIVPIIEDDEGGVTWEQAIIREYEKYQNKTFMMKRSYPGTHLHENYSWMQTTSLFSTLDENDRLYEWSSVLEFKVMIDNVLADIVATIED